MHSRERGARGAPHRYLRKTHMRRETNNSKKYLAERNSRGVCEIVSNSPNGMGRQKASEYVKRDL